MLPESRAQILVVDDEANLRRVLGAVLEREGYDVFVAADGREALNVLANHHVDVVVTDVRMPEMDGMALLREVQRVDADIPVVMITAHSTVDNAVLALKSGAFDYLTKPFEQSEVKDVVRRALQTRRIADREAHRPSVVSVWEGSTVVGTSAAAMALMHSLEEAARRESHVLFIGERGTGKELLARALHRVSSRQMAPFVKLHCETAAGELGTELFGGEAPISGMARPGKLELAEGGTLFVEEASSAAYGIQERLAEVMRTGTFTRESDAVRSSVRVMATLRGQPGETPLVTGLRSEFVTVLRVPPLRERLQDIPALCRYFMARYSERLSKAIDDVSNDVFEALARHTWPGNLRELENVIEHAVLFCEGPVLGARFLPALGTPTGDAEPPLSGGAGLGALSDVAKHGLKEQVREATSKLERDLINRALLETNGNVTHAARLLKISRKGLQLKMKELGLRERD
jgi:two-component system, NtrC family, response regulator AtoC